MVTAKKYLFLRLHQRLINAMNFFKIIFIFYFATTFNGLFAAGYITEYGIPGCIELKNGKTRVVIDPNIGGRVLVYEINGINILYFDRKNTGITDGKKVQKVDAGRFDFGPVKTIPNHKKYFKGKWNATITGELSVRLTSQIDPKHNIQIIRDFSLDKNSSRLICKQTLINKGNKPLRRYLWSRTFVPGDGIYMMPLNPESRFPRKYATYIRIDGNPMVDYIPHPEKNVITEDDMLIINGPSDYKRLLTDAANGLLVCLFDTNVMFFKKYDVAPGRKYGDIVCATASIWHFEDKIYEIEAMGPEELVLPGDSISFTETWFLTEYKFPAKRKPDIQNVMKKIEEY